MKRLSIVIPHTGDNERLETTLLSVLENRPEGCEILVVLSEIYNDPYELAAGDEVSFIYAPIGTDPVRCLNLGIDASRAPVVHFLSPGMVVMPGWSETALARLDRDPSVTAVSPLVYDMKSGRSILSRGLSYRLGGSVLNVTREDTPVLGPSHYVAFYRKSALTVLDRFDVELGEAAADVDLTLKLEAIGGKTVTEPMCCVFFDRPLERRIDGFTSAKAMERLFWRWASKKGWIRSLASHGGRTVLDILTLLVKPSTLSGLFGRLIGLFSIGSHRQLHKQLETAINRTCLAAASETPQPSERSDLRAA